MEKIEIKFQADDNQAIWLVLDNESLEITVYNGRGIVTGAGDSIQIYGRNVMKLVSFLPGIVEVLKTQR